MMIKVSIIMPVYNSERFLTNAVESILRQDFEDFELILVDDGSTDGSGQICDRFGSSSDKIVVIHKENGGISSARNAGLKQASGEYVGFCDNDDEFLPGLIRDNYELAQKENADLVRFNRIKRYIRDNGKSYDTVTDMPEYLIVKRDEFCENYRAIHQDTVWTALYRRKIIKDRDIHFDENMHYCNEDLSFNLQFFRYTEKMVIRNKPYYIWNQRETHSTSRKFAMEGADSRIQTLSLEKQLIEETSGNKMDRYDRNLFLLNNYVYWIVEYLSLPLCRLRTDEKCSILERLRRNSLFDELRPDDVLRKLRGENRRAWLTLKLFYDEKYRMLLLITGRGTRVLGKLRSLRH